MIQVLIDVQKHDLGGSEFVGIAVVDAFRELGEGVETMKP